MRIVSHTCSNTEIVCALGCANLLVGVDDHSDYPVEVVRKLPRIGPDLSVDVEKVKELKPDLVLTSLTVPGHEKIIEALQAAKLPLLVVEPVSLNDVYSDISRIAEALGVSSRGQDLVSRMRAQAADIGAPVESRPSILVEWWPKPVIVPGRYSWVSDMLAAVGAKNPWRERECKSTPIADSEVIAAAPDAVVQLLDEGILHSSRASNISLGAFAAITALVHRSSLYVASVAESSRRRTGVHASQC